MILSIKHEDIDFEFEIERIEFEDNPLTDRNIHFEMTSILHFVMTSIQDMHHLEHIFKDHLAALDIPDDDKGLFGTFISAYADENIIVQIPMQCLTGLNIEIE